MKHPLIPPKGSTRVKVLLGILLGIIIVAGAILVLQAKGIINPGFLKTQIPAGYAQSYTISTTKITNVSINHNSSGDIITIGHSDTDMDSDCADEGAQLSVNYSPASLSYSPSSGWCIGTYTAPSLHITDGISININSGSINMSTYGSSSSSVTSWNTYEDSSITVSSSAPACDSGYYWDSSSQSCVSSCGTTGTWNGSYCEYPTPKSCGIGEKCTSGSWCNMGQQCFYSDSSFTCIDWNSSCPTGTTYCSQSDTNCIEPGGKGPLTGWCKNGKECYTSDGLQKYCQPWSTTSGATISCPSGMSACSPTDQYCLDIGETSTQSGAWCSGGKQCYLSNSSTTCVKYEDSCPADATSCRPTETNCVEPGKTSTLSSAWCGGSSMPCYKDNTLYCQPMSSTDMTDWQTAKCPTGYGRCQSTDQWCLEIGETGPSGSWCAGGKQEYIDNNKVKCVPYDSSVVEEPEEEPEEPEEQPITCTEKHCYNSSGSIESCIKWGQKCPSEYEEEQPEEEKETTYCDPQDTSRQWSELKMRIKDKERWVKDTEKEYKFFDPTPYLDVEVVAENVKLLKSMRTIVDEMKTKLSANTSTKKDCELIEAIRNLEENYEEAQREFDNNRQLFNLYVYDIKNVEKELRRISREIEHEIKRAERDKDEDFIGDLKEFAEKVADVQKDIIAYVIKEESLATDEIRGSDIWFVFENLQREFDEIRNERNTNNFYKFLEDQLEQLKRDFAEAISMNLPQEKTSRIDGLMAEAAQLIEDKNYEQAQPKVDEAFKILRRFWESKNIEDRTIDNFQYQFEEEVWGSIESIVFEVTDDPLTFFSRIMENGLQSLVETTLITVKTRIDEAMAQRATKLLDNLTKLSETRVKEALTRYNNLLDTVEELYTSNFDERFQEIIDNQIFGPLASNYWSNTATNDINYYTSIAMEAQQQGDSETMEEALNSITEITNNPEADLANQVSEGLIRFPDAPLHEWYGPYINGAADYGLMKGDPSGNSRPGDPTNRAEAIQMLVNATQLPVTPVTQSPFSDVPASEWYASPIVTYESNFGNLEQFLAIKNNKLDPSEEITRVEFARLYYKAFKDRLPVTTSYDAVEEFADYGTISSKDYEAVATLKENGIMVGDAGNVFNGDSTLNRAAFAKMLLMGNELMQ